MNQITKIDAAKAEGTQERTRRMGKKLVWKNCESCGDYYSDAVIITGARVFEPRTSEDLTLYASEGWHIIGSRRPEGEFKLSPVKNVPIRRPFGGETIARHYYLLRAVDDLEGFYYAGSDICEPLRSWRLTIASANASFLNDLDFQLAENPECERNGYENNDVICRLRRFGKVSTALITKDLARAAYNGTPPEHEMLGLLKS